MKSIDFQKIQHKFDDRCMLELTNLGIPYKFYSLPILTIPPCTGLLIYIGIYLPQAVPNVLISSIYYFLNKEAVFTRCSSFLRRRGGCSCRTESARTVSVTSTWARTLSRGANLTEALLLVWWRAASTSSLHRIWAARTTIWACNAKTIWTPTHYHCFIRER